MVVTTPLSARFRVMNGTTPGSGVAASVGNIDPTLTRDRALSLRDALDILRDGPVHRPQLVLTEVLSEQ
jgi:hypothetical protein